MELEGRVAIVTGAGRGIGREIALRLAQAGADVVVNDIGDAAPAESVTGEIRAIGRKSMAFMGDVSAAADVNRMVDESVAAFGKVDILINNAGIARDKLLIRMTDDEWDKVITVDLRSVFLCTRAVLRPMMKQRYGRIISMASIVGIVGNPGQANYAAAKAGIIGFTRSIAKEVGSRNITVNAIAPGYIDTAMTKDLPSEWKEELKKRIPLGFIGEASDVADAVAFLASGRARYITGQVLSVDGGMGMAGI